MKKVLILVVTLMVVLSSCSVYTCATYSRKAPGTKTPVRSI